MNQAPYFAGEIAPLLATRELSSREITQSFLARMER